MAEPKTNPLSFALFLWSCIDSFTCASPWNFNNRFLFLYGIQVPSLEDISAMLWILFSSTKPEA